MSPTKCTRNKQRLAPLGVILRGTQGFGEALDFSRHAIAFRTKRIQCFGFGGHRDIDIVPKAVREDTSPASDAAHASGGRLGWTADSVGAACDIHHRVFAVQQELADFLAGRGRKALLGDDGDDAMAGGSPGEGGQAARSNSRARVGRRKRLPHISITDPPSSDRSPSASSRATRDSARPVCRSSARPTRPGVRLKLCWLVRTGRWPGAGGIRSALSVTPLTAARSNSTDPTPDAELSASHPPDAPKILSASASTAAIRDYQRVRQRLLFFTALSCFAQRIAPCRVNWTHSRHLMSNLHAEIELLR